VPALSRLLDLVWYRGHWAKWILWPLTPVYIAAAAARRKRDEQTRVDFEVPVIVVGNLTVGGTGKTPLVIWLVARLSERGYRPGIVCSGYRGQAKSWPQRVTADSEADQVGDEAVLLAQRARCPVVAGPDRVANVQALLAGGTVDVVVSDDGLQHYRLGRLIEIAVIDGMRGLGNGLCLPAGPLREPAARLREVDAIVVNGGKWGHAGVFRADVVATGVRQTATGTMKTLKEFEDKEVHAVAAIGHPDRFFTLLENHGLIVEPHALPDHAPLRAEHLRFEDEYPVLITEKDEVKCKAFAEDNVWCVVVDLQLGEQDTERLLRTAGRLLDRASP
jgi:tetraacyldisaccharide 4'-kinase